MAVALHRTQLDVETAIETDQLSAGEKLCGSFALRNVKPGSIRSVEITLIATIAENRGSVWADTAVDVRHPVWGESALSEGVSYPFSHRLPMSLTPSFHGDLLRLSWALETRVVIAFGFDIVDSIPLTIGPSSSTRAEPLGRSPLIGDERRARIWAEAAKTRQLRFDSDQFIVSGTVSGVELHIWQEPRKETSHLVASMQWVPLGLGVSVTEGWSFAVDGRLKVRADEEAQRLAFLTPNVLSDLEGYAQVSLDDAGAELSKEGDDGSVAGLTAFIDGAIATAHALNEATLRVPPPGDLAQAVTAWVAAAKHFEGRLEMATMSIREVTYRGWPVELIHRRELDGSMSAPVARALRQTAGAVSPEAQRTADSVSRECTNLKITDNAVEASFTGADPMRVETLWRALIRVAKALSDATATTP